jgi:hypothetical protein
MESHGRANKNFSVRETWKLIFKEELARFRFSLLGKVMSEGKSVRNILLSVKLKVDMLLTVFFRLPVYGSEIGVYFKLGSKSWYVEGE